MLVPLQGAEDILLYVNDNCHARSVKVMADNVSVICIYIFLTFEMCK